MPRRPPRCDGFALLLVVLSALLLLFLLLPLAATVLDARPQDVASALAAEDVRASLWLTAYAGAISTGLGLLGGVPLAYLLARRRFPGQGLIGALISLPVVLPHTAAGVALLVVFGRFGPLGRALAPLGLRFADRVPGIVVGMAFVSVPFMVNAATESFRLIDPELERVAQLDGASSWQAFRLVTLPLALRGILSGALMMWARGVSEFGAVVILAYHPRIIPVLVYERMIGLGLAEARPLTAIVIVGALLVMGLLRWLARERPEGTDTPSPI